ncbi:MAG: hypothetical protein J6Z23_04240 [Lachnospiraceae bacterium]|nr:hypothetical protein [Lachnospiraceae bacterium]
MKDYKEMFDNVMERAGEERRKRAAVKRKALEIGLPVLAAVVLSLSGILLYKNVIRPENGRQPAVGSQEESRYGGVGHGTQAPSDRDPDWTLSSSAVPDETVPSGEGTTDPGPDPTETPVFPTHAEHQYTVTSTGAAEAPGHTPTNGAVTESESSPAYESSPKEDGFYYAAVLPDDAENDADYVLIRYEVVNASAGTIPYYVAEGQTVGILVDPAEAAALNSFYSGQLNTFVAEVAASGQFAAGNRVFSQEDTFVLPVELTNLSGREISPEAVRQAVVSPMQGAGPETDLRLELSFPGAEETE